MDEDTAKEVTEEITPLEVKIMNNKKETTPYTPSDNEYYENINITEEEITEFVES